MFQSETSESWECDAVAICFGLHIDPYVPQILGIEYVLRVFLSSEYKQRKDCGKRKNVMILGVGENAMDLSYLVMTSPTKSVTLCHHDGLFFAPKVCSNF